MDILIYIYMYINIYIYNPMNRLRKNTLKKSFPHILTWNCEFRLGNKTVYVKFYEESEF